MAATPLAIDWLRPLATPYLRGYRAVAQRTGSLRGYWFLHPASGHPADAVQGEEGSGASQLGFFVGYLVHPAGFAEWSPQPPECLVVALVGPVGGSLHRRLVAVPDSLLRETFTYIRWLTHRPPRFLFQESLSAAMVRHQSMRDWPAEKYEHFSRNFHIETLAWLVRSGLVRKLLEEELAPATRVAKRAAKFRSNRAKSRHKP